MFARLCQKLTVLRRSIPLLLFAAVLPACGDEVSNMADRGVNPSEENLYCAGFHSFSVPEGFRPANLSAQFGGGKVSIERGFRGSVPEFVNADRDQGQIVRNQTVNGWNVIIAERNVGGGKGNPGSMTLNLAQRLDGDLLVIREGFRVSALPDGLESPALTQLPQHTQIRRLSADTIHQGFCVDNFVFVQDERRPGERISFSFLGPAVDSEARQVITVDMGYGRFQPHDLPSDMRARGGDALGAAIAGSGASFDISTLTQGGRTGELLAAIDADGTEIEGQAVFSGKPNLDQQPALLITYSNAPSVEELRLRLTSLVETMRFNR